MLKSSYIKTHICEYFFTLMISFGLAINVASSFVMEESVLSNHLLMIAVVAVLNLLLFVAGINKKTAIVGIVVYILLATAGTVYMISSGRLTSLEGEKSGYSLMIIILVVCTTVVYLATRNRRILIAFIPTSLIVCAAFRFLEYPVSVVGFILLVLGLGLELIYKVYYDSLMEAALGNYNIGHFFIQSLVIALVVSCITYPVYTFVIKPANMPTRDLKLVTKLLSWDVIDKVGISSKTEVLSDTVKSDRITDKELEKEDPTEKPRQEEKEDVTQKEKRELPAFAIKYDYKEKSNLWMLSFVAIVPIVPFAVKYLQRRKQRKKIEDLSPADGCIYLYNYFLKKFKAARLTKPENSTLLEYVKNNYKELAGFDTQSGTTFGQITEVYVKEIYGGYVPDEDDYNKFKDYYYGFFKNMKKYVGKAKYIFKFWLV